MADNLESVTPVDDGEFVGQFEDDGDAAVERIHHLLESIHYMNTATREDLSYVLDHLKAVQNEIADLRQGVVATFNGVDWLIKMLSGVQQMAANMPGITGKFVRKFAGDMAQAPVEENHNG